MSFIASDPLQGLGTIIDNGHCMRHVQIVAGVPHSSRLRRGLRVRDVEDVPPRGTVIATFDAAGRYANATDGSSHIAIFLERRSDGLRVVDQWRGRAGGVGERTIPFRLGRGSPADDADAYYIAEDETWQPPATATV
jgi:hypothetical protein